MTSATKDYQIKRLTKQKNLAEFLRKWDDFYFYEAELKRVEETEVEKEQNRLFGYPKTSFK